MKKLTAALAFIFLLAFLGSCTPTELKINGETHSLNETKLYLHNKGLENGDIKNLRHAKNVLHLSLADNSITDISPLKDLTTLTFLDISGNEIESIQDLKALVNLTQLYIGDNKITDVSVLKELPNLVELKMSGTYSDGLSMLKEMTGLTSLEWTESGLTREQMDELMEALPNCDIWFAQRQQ